MSTARQLDRAVSLPPSDEVLGEGAHSVVYAVSMRGQPVALKVSRLPAAERDTAARFRAEAAALARSRHPGLVEVFEAGVGKDGFAYIAMEHVRGQTLAQRLSEGPLPVPRVLELALQIAEALGAVHGGGLVHRDLKPSNVLLPEGGARAKLIDFGLVADRHAEGGPAAGAVGTFLYAAPEQTGMLNLPVDGRSDLYSLGVLLYECLAGKPPFGAKDAGELIRKHALETPRSLTSRGIEVPAALDALLARLLAKDPDDRYVDTAALCADLKRLQAGELDAADVQAVARAEVRHVAPLVGRQQAMAQLMSRVHSAREGRGSVVGLCGEAGAGKTRVVAELAGRMRNARALCLLAPSPGATPAPLSLFKAMVAQLLRELRYGGEADRAALRLRIREAAGDYGRYLAALFPELRSLLAVEDADVADAGQEIHQDALAHLFAHLGTPDSPCLLGVEDLDRLDEDSRRVLGRLMQRASRAHLVVLCTSRDGDWDALQVAPKLSIALEPLRDDEVASLLCALLASDTLDAALIEQFVSRCRGNPLSVVEHARAMVDSGALVPTWASWNLELARLAELHLPQNVSDLVLARLGQLEDAHLQILTEAAVLGSELRASTAAELSEAPPEDVSLAFAQATEAGVLQRREDDVLAFLQERARQHLLDRLSPERKAALHRRAAQLEGTRVDGNSEAVYACARHYFACADEALAAEACAANTRAGQLALAEQAPGEALVFLGQARTLCERFGIEGGFALWGSLADAYAASAQPEACIEVTPAAVACCTDRYAKVDLLKRAADLRVMSAGGEFTRQTLEQAYAELGLRMPRNSPVQLCHLFIDIGRALWLEFVAPRLFKRRHPERERFYRTLSQLTEVTNRLALVENHMFILVGLMFRVFIYGLKSGPGRERAWAYAAHEVTLAMFRLPARWSRRYYDVAIREARAMQDRVTEGRVELLHAMVPGLLGDLAGSAKQSKKHLARYHRWLTSADLMMFYGSLSQNLSSRGYTLDAAKVLRMLSERTEEAVGGSEQVDGMRDAALALEMLFSRPDVAAEHTQKGIEGVEVDNPIGWASAWGQRLIFLLETEDLGQLDHAIEQADRVECKGPIAGIQAAPFFYAKARARIAQALEATLAEQETRIAQLKEAEKALGVLGNAPPARCLKLLLQATAEFIVGDSDGALRKTSEAEGLSVTTDCPEATFEALLLRATMLETLGQQAPAVRDLQSAQQIAEGLGWEARVQRVGRRLGPRSTRSRSSSQNMTATLTRTHMGGSITVEADRLQRDRDALVDVSLAAANVFDPAEQARAALDRIVSILGAERSFLFLWNEETSELELLAARGREREDLTGEAPPESVIERVRATRAPLVINGTEEGAALGFTSIVSQDVRSMISAPLMLRERFTGVVYLDSRLAKGVFNDADVDILRAIANQIAISQETARSAQREIERRALEKDLALSAAVQNLLLPTDDTWVDGHVRLCAFYEPAAQVGGDFWFASRLADGRLRLFVADVAGHGVGSSMVTAAVAGCYRALGAGAVPGGPVLEAEALMAEIHRILQSVCQGEYTMPATLIEVDEQGQVGWWSAAAPAVMVRRVSGDVKLFTARGIPLGSDGFAVGHQRFELEPGDRLLALTDGIPELEMAGGRALGLKRLKKFFAAKGGLALQRARTELVAAVREAQGGVPADDDQTFVMLERAPE